MIVKSDGYIRVKQTYDKIQITHLHDPMVPS